MATPAHLFIPAPRAPEEVGSAAPARPAPARPSAPPPAPNAVVLLEQARTRLREAAAAHRATERCVHAHLAALRAATAVVVERSWRRVARPCARVPGSVWRQLAEVAPELREWADHFAAGSLRRAAAEAGSSAITPGEAELSLRHATEFVEVVERSLPGAAR